MYRLIFLALFFGACSNATPSDQAAEGTEAAEKTETTKLKQFDSMNQAAEVIIKNIPSEITLTPEQKDQINALVAEYDLNDFNVDRNVRAKIRQRVIQEILTPEQAKIWKTALQKNKASITIE